MACWRSRWTRSASISKWHRRARSCRTSCRWRRRMHRQWGIVRGEELDARLLAQRVGRGGVASAVAAQTSLKRNLGRPRHGFAAFVSFLPTPGQNLCSAMASNRRRAEVSRARSARPPNSSWWGLGARRQTSGAWRPAQQAAAVQLSRVCRRLYATSPHWPV